MTIAYIKRCSWQYIVWKVNRINASYIGGIDCWRLIASLTRVRFVRCNNGFIRVSLCLCFYITLVSATKGGLIRFSLTDIRVRVRASSILISGIRTH